LLLPEVLCAVSRFALSSGAAMFVFTTGAVLAKAAPAGTPAETALPSGYEGRGRTYVMVFPPAYIWVGLGDNAAAPFDVCRLHPGILLGTKSRLMCQPKEPW
jgi:hypothetical protein